MLLAVKMPDTAALRVFTAPATDAGVTSVERVLLSARSNGLPLCVISAETAVVKVVTFAMTGPDELVGTLATTDVSGCAVLPGSVATMENGAVSPASGTR